MNHLQKKSQTLRLAVDSVTSNRNFCACGVTKVGELLEKWRQNFENLWVCEPVASIEHIMAHCLHTHRISDVYKYKDSTLSEDKRKEIESLCVRRLQNVPVQYLLGEWSFRQLTLKMAPPVFIPRPETEQLVDIVLPDVPENGHILDLCCGSGAIALSLLQEKPSIKATAVDQSESACQLTKENAHNNGLNNRIRVIQRQLEHWNSSEKFSIIVSNPPYIFGSDLDTLQPDIRLYEDLKALDGGDQGLNVIKLILDLTCEHLNDNGKLFLEVEPRHPQLLEDYLLLNKGLGLSLVKSYKDFCGKERFVEIIKTPSENSKHLQEKEGFAK